MELQFNSHGLLVFKVRLTEIDIVAMLRTKEQHTLADTLETTRVWLPGEP